MNICDNYKEISAYELENAYKLIAKDWMLITASDGDKVNAMTASWAGLGELWNRHIAISFIRPQRYTFELAEREERVSLAFFDEEYRDALNLCGKRSGRDCDKLSEAGLTTAVIDGTPVINEARMVLICKKLYSDFIREDSFVDKSMLQFYKAGDFHKFYFFEIEKILVKK